ncbi:hypothetical protein [Micromonospora zamorensis]|uniref:hypothetical protein n=1 Tax=Micromonospora zamorensis TaxID=709883 RepID=UPI0033A9926A
MPGVRLHDLRHTVVSPLMELVVPPHVVQAIAWHADVKITLKVHAQANLDAMRQALVNAVAVNRSTRGRADPGNA